MQAGKTRISHARVIAGRPKWPGHFGEGDAAGWRQRQQEPEEHDAGRDPCGDHRKLVHREVADRALVAVIEAEQLRDQEPAGQHGERPHGARVPAGDEQACNHSGAEVAQGEHPPPSHVAPEAICIGPPDPKRVDLTARLRSRCEHRPC